MQYTAKQKTTNDNRHYLRCARVNMNMTGKIK